MYCFELFQSRIAGRTISLVHSRQDYTDITSCNSLVGLCDRQSKAYRSLKEAQLILAFGFLALSYMPTTRQPAGNRTCTLNPLGTFDERDSSPAYLGEVTVDE
ncbi:hypothetical protein AVEN_208854-1 [Araneus ventricosus]|uniref:Uncharacterized protein n=1 Tax=Araneus ventricosus TaxID=182803 RepID=A0A4Y2KMT3_ARAVE|nr:hypothetical protein AVEN_208854-1 [Araneus ventricosus]